MSSALLRIRVFRFRFAGLLTAWLLAAQAFAVHKPAAGDDDLIQMVRAAKASFQPLDPRRLQDDKAALLAAIEELDVFMTQSGPQIAGQWKAYFDWPSLQTQVHSDRPDWPALHRVLNKFYENHPGLEWPRCVAVRERLQRFITVGSLLDEPRLEEMYQQQLDGLAQQLEHFGKSPSGELAAAIGRRLAWLQNFEPQGAHLAEAVRARYSRTNGVGYVSASFVDAMVGRDANDRRTVREYILRTSTVGPAQTEGRAYAELMSNPQRAEFEIRLQGETLVDPNIGFRGSLTIYSTADTQIDARKRAYIDATGVHSEPAQAHCTTDVQTYHIEAPRTIMEFIARRMANRKNPEAESEGSQRAEHRAARQLDTDADSLLSVANRVFHEQFRAPLVRLGAFPTTLSFSSTEHHLLASVQAAGDAQLGAWDAPPRLSARHDLGACMHESLVNNLCETMLGGKTFKDTAWLELMQLLVADAPKPLWVYAGSERWSTVLAKHRPLTVVFANNRCWVTIRLQQVTRGDQQLQRPVQIQGEFRLKSTPVGPRLVRAGDLQITFSDGPITEQDAEMVAFVRQKFEGVLLPELAFEISLPTEKLSSLEMTEFCIRDGWMIFGYQLTALRSRLYDVAKQKN